MKETFYFPHDYNARNDPKLQNVLIDLGVEGIGVFWCIIEQLYEQGGTLPISSCKSIAFALHVDCKVVESLIFDFDLFPNDGEKFWSESVNTRLCKMNSIRDKRREAISRRWSKKQSVDTGQIDTNVSEIDTNVSEIDTNVSEIDTNVSLVYPQLFKEKEKKVDKEKKKENIEEKENTPKGVKEKEKSETAKRFVPPTFEEAKARMEEMGYTFDVESFIAFYQSKNWMVGKNKMKDWKAAMVTWQKRENNFPRKISTKKANEEW